MRTLDAGTEKAWRAGLISVHAKVVIGGVEVTNLEGIDWLHALSWSADVDSQVDTAEIELLRDFGGLSLATFRDNSKLNEGGTVVDVWKTVQISVSVLPPDNRPASSDWVPVFDGYVDEVDWSGSIIKLRCRDKGARLADRFIETIQVYGTDAGRDLELVIQDILDAVFGASVITLYSINGTGGTPFQPGDSPGWKLHKFYQSKQRVLEAIRSLATMIGWEVKYRYNPNTSSFELTLYEPARAKTTPDFTFANPNEYFDITQLTTSVVNVRNAGAMVFADIGGVVMTGGPLVTFADNSPAQDTITRSGGSFITDGFLGNQKIKVIGSANNDGIYQVDTVAALVLTLKAEDSTLTNEGPVAGVAISTGLRTTIKDYDFTSIAKYGRRYFELTEESSSQIDTVTEGEAMLAAALSDLSEPTAIVGMTVLLFPWVNLAPGDLWQIPSNDVHWDAAQKFAPQKIQHTLSAGGDSRTSVVLAGKVSGGTRRWLEREGGTGIAAAIDDKEDSAPSNTSSSGAAGGIILEFDDPRYTSPPMPDWAYTEVHLNTTTPYTPSAATFAKRIRDTRVELTGLVPGQTYYIILVHYDQQGNASQQSAIITQATEWVGPYHQNPDREYGVMLMNSDFGAQTKSPTTYMPDFWSVNVGSYGASGDIYQSDGSPLAMTGSPNITFADVNPDTITRSAGSFVTDGFRAGQYITVSGSTSNNGTFLVASVAALVLTLDAAETLTNEGPVGGVTITTGSKSKSGNRSIVFRNTGGTTEVSFWSDIFPIAEEELYGGQFSFLYTGAANVVILGLRIKYYDRNKSYMSGSDYVVEGYVASVFWPFNPGVWEPVGSETRAKIDPPTGARYARAEMYCDPNGDPITIYVDSAKISRSKASMRASIGLQSVPTGTWTQLNLADSGTGNFDYTNVYNASFQFVPKTDGMYNLNAAATVTGLGAGAEVRLAFVIGGTRYEGNSLVKTAVGTDTATISMTVSLASGTVVTLEIIHNHGSNRDVAAWWTAAGIGARE